MNSLVSALGLVEPLRFPLYTLRIMLEFLSGCRAGAHQIKKIYCKVVSSIPGADLRFQTQ